MKKEINKLNQKRTNAFMLSPVAFALAACGGGGGNTSHEDTSQENEQISSSEQDAVDAAIAAASEINWPYPSIIEDLNPWYDLNSWGTGISYEGRTVEDGTVIVSKEIVDAYTPDGGSVVLTWFRDGEQQTTENKLEYEFSQADVGKHIILEAVFYDSTGQLDSLRVMGFSEIQNNNDKPKGEVIVSGEMMLGETLASDVSTITDEDGLGTFSFQWQRGGRDIEGATAATYTLTDIDVGNTISLDVSYVDAYGRPENLSYNSDIIVSLELPFKTIVPEISNVVGETQWGDTWYTGNAELAVDGNSITKWTYEGLGQITFDLGKEYNIDSVFITFDGSVSNGNSINLYVDDVLVASGVQPASSKTWDIEDTVGRYVTYETVAEPHNEYLQVATWSEISEFNVMAQEIIA
jgi:hypothetical protein